MPQLLLVTANSDALLLVTLDTATDTPPMFVMVAMYGEFDVLTVYAPKDVRTAVLPEWV